MNVYSATNIGLVREENQDKVKTSMLEENSALAIVCDGMGGENAGSEASERAINIIYDRITKVYRPDSDSNSVRTLLISAISTANAVVFDVSMSSIDKKGMGTTCVIALRIDDTLHITSVGDSRAYLIYKNDDNKYDITQVTKDHSVVMQMYENGEITKDEIENHPKRNYITKAIGVGPAIFPDYYEIDLDDDSIVILCSDGLSNHCNEDSILQTVLTNAPPLLCSALIQKALDDGGKDNVTVAVITE